MVNIHIYVYKKNEDTGNMEWQPRQGVYPLVLNERLDEELDSGSYMFYTKSSEILPPLTMVKVVLDDQDTDVENDTDFNTKTMYFLGNDSCVRFNSQIWEHTFDLVEPSKLLEGIKIDGRAVVQPENEAERKSLLVVLNELLEITPLRAVVEGEIEYQVTSDERVVAALSSINSPEYRWDSQTTLWECLSDIGAMIDAIPRLTAKSAETKFNTITFDFVNEAKNVVSAMDYNACCKGVVEEQFCSALETNAENIVPSNEEEASVVFPGNDMWTTPRTEEVKLDTDNCTIILPNNIEKLLHVYMYSPKSFVAYNGISVAATGGGGTPFSTQFTLHELDMEYLDITKYCVEYNEWIALEQQEYSKASTDLYKNNTFYYEIGSNILNLVGTKYKNTALFGKSSVWEMLLSSVIKEMKENGELKSWTVNESNRVVSYSPKGTVVNCPEIRTWNLRIEYIPSNNNTKTRVVKTNPVSTEFVQTYNQRAQVNSSSLMGRSMKSTVEKMGVYNLRVFKAYKTLNDVLSIGDVYIHDGETYIVTTLNIELLAHRLYAITYEMSKNWSLLSKYVGLDRRFRSWNIPNDILERNLYDSDYCVIGREHDSDTGIRINNNGKESIFGVLDSNFSNKKTKINNCWFFQDSYKVNGNDCNDGVALPCTSFAMSNSLIFSARTFDNLSAGKRIEKGLVDAEEDAKGDYCIDTYYCSKDGTLENMTISLAPGFMSSDSDSRIVLDPKAFPFARRIYSVVMSQQQYLNYPSGTVMSANYNVKKSPAEQLNYTYQIHFVTALNDIVIGPKLSENNPLVRNMESRTFKVWGLTKKLPKSTFKINDYFGKYDESNNFTYTTYSYSIYGARLTSVVLEATSGTDYIGWAITDENDYLYLAQNSMNEVSTEKPIYLNLKHKFHGQ